MEATAERIDGVLASWNEARGFGFIAPAVGGRDVFVHISAFANGAKRPHVGDALTFEVELSPQGKRRARSVLPMGAKSTDRRRPAKSSAPRSAAGYLAVGAFFALYVVVSLVWGLPPWVAVLYLGSSIVSFAVYASDKSAATTGRWRTSESTLLVFGLIGGWPGSVIAQRVLRHKTRKVAFQRAFWGTVALNVAAFVTSSSLNAGDLLFDIALR